MSSTFTIHKRCDEAQSTSSAEAARELIRLLTPLSPPADLAQASPAMSEAGYREILSAIRTLTPTLMPNNPVFASFHDDQVHDPLGAGSYAFQDDIIGPILLAIKNDEADVPPRAANPAEPTQAPSRPVVIHAGAQPNNSPHVGTLIVFCHAFSLAREMRRRLQIDMASTEDKSPRPSIAVEITFVDTAPVAGKDVKDMPGALGTYMADYRHVLCFLSMWSGVPYTISFQSGFFAQPSAPDLVQYVVSHREILNRQLSPRYGSLALRAACPVAGCGLSEKHGRLNLYDDVHSTITFDCPDHGPHTICTLKPAEVARLEANAPTRNLIRSMSHLLDDSTHHVRVTGADYAGMYQEMFLYRPLAAWSAATGLGVGKTPHIVYAPLVVDWSGAKLSKSLYVRKGGYEAMKLLGIDGLCSYAQLKTHFGGHGEEGLRRIWDLVQGWVADPRKLFRTFSVEYLHRVIIEAKVG